VRLREPRLLARQELGRAAHCAEHTATAACRISKRRQRGSDQFQAPRFSPRLHGVVDRPDYVSTGALFEDARLAKV
jgi:hypothetical protein